MASCLCTHPRLLCQGYAFPLPLPDHAPFELCHGPKQGQEQVGHGRVLAGEGEVLFHEAYVHALLGQIEDHPPQIIQVPAAKCVTTGYGCLWESSTKTAP
jgi:hypothetical protein